MARYGTVVEDDTVYVHTETGRLEVGDLETIVSFVGGPAWTISYTEAEKEQYPPHRIADEGLTVDVVDTINAMTFGEDFVETLAAQPAEPVAAAEATGGDAGGESEHVSAEAGIAGGETVSPRLGLFVGRLLENLEYGLR